MGEHRVVVRGLPRWLEWRRLLGPGAWQAEGSEPGLELSATLTTADAADLAERLRGLGLGGSPVAVEIAPPLNRPAIRRARTEAARHRREKSPGFGRRGARLDAEGHRSLTPEALALALGRAAAGRSVLDAGCGCGGNAIGFARAGSTVIAVEHDAERLALARHNARLYGVGDRIRFIHGDAVAAAGAERAQILFVDPPWGGDYDRRRVELAQLPLLEQLIPFAARFESLWAKVPPSFDVAGVEGCEPRAVFGDAEGDRRRIKFLWLTLERA